MLDKFWINNSGKIIGPVTAEDFVSALNAGKFNSTNLRFGSSPDGPWSQLTQFTPASQIASSSEGWHWMNSGFFSNSSVGPSTGKELIRAFEKGKLKSQTPVFHAIFTENEWMDFDATLLKGAYRTLESDRKAEAQQEWAIQQDQAKREKENEQIRFEEEQLRLKEENRQALLDSNWEYDLIVDEIDDSRLHTFGLVAESGTDKYGGPIHLYVRFGNNTADLLIHWGQTCFADAHTTFAQSVQARSGKHQGGVLAWNVTNDLTGTILGGNNAFHAIRSFFDVDKAVFSVTPYHANAITAIFNVRGLKAELTMYKGKIRQIAKIPNKVNHRWCSRPDLRLPKQVSSDLF